MDFAGGSAWTGLLKYVTDGAMTFPEIHAQLEKSLGQARYAKESKFWSTVVDDLDRSTMSYLQLIGQFNKAHEQYKERRENEFVSTVHLGCKPTQNNSSTQDSILETFASGKVESNGMHD